MEEKIKAIINKLYHVSKEEAEACKQELIAMVDEYGKASVVSALEGSKKKELLKIIHYAMIALYVYDQED